MLLLEQGRIVLQKIELMGFTFLYFPVDRGGQIFFHEDFFKDIVRLHAFADINNRYLQRAEFFV